MFPYAACMCFKPRKARRWKVEVAGKQTAFVKTSKNGLFIQVLGNVSQESAEEGEAPGAKRQTVASTLMAELGMGLDVVESEGPYYSRGYRRGSAPRPSRFLTLHRRKRRKPPNRALFKNVALLDDIYNGPTQCLLDRIGVWDFNTFALDSVCGGRPVSVLCVFLMHKYGLLRTFNVDSVTVWKCFNLIEDGYHVTNPYHNAVHAADVTQAMHCYLQEDAIGQYLTPIETMAALIAAVCHDLDHPGVNQSFLVSTDNHLVALYKETSVLENHHWRCAMGCLMESGVLDNWKSKDIVLLQDIIRSLILATDITRQPEFLLQFRSYLDTGTFDMTKPECRLFALQIALKCADICNPCRPWDISSRWSVKICDEFYRQGDYERQLNLPVTPFCDKYVTSVAKIQEGFIKFFVAPLFDSWNEWLNSRLTRLMVQYMHANLQHWEKELAKEKLEPVSSPVMFTLEGASSQSTIEEPQSTLGSLESIPHGSVLGRRHSLPLSLSCVIPTTTIRRESMPESTGGSFSVVMETVVVGSYSHSSVTSSQAVLPISVSPVTADSLLPDPSLLTMCEVKKQTKTHSRRLSLPHFCRFGKSRSSLPSLEPLPGTPLQEELPGGASLEKEKEKKQFSGVGGQTRTENLQGTESSARVTSGSYDRGSVFQETKMPGKEFCERGSIFRSGHRTKGPIYCMSAESAKGIRQDKENLSPLEKDQMPSFYRTRAWRSLNYEEDGKHFKAGKFTNTQGFQSNKSRRGSAPLLKSEEFKGFKMANDRSLECLYHSRRRGSAPPYHHRHGLKILGGGNMSSCGGRIGCGGTGGGLKEKPLFTKFRSFSKSLNRTASLSLLDALHSSASDGGDRESCLEKSKSVVVPPLVSKENITSVMLTNRRGSFPIELMAARRMEESSIAATPESVDAHKRCLLQSSSKEKKESYNVAGGTLSSSPPFHRFFIGDEFHGESRRSSNGFDVLSDRCRCRAGDSFHSSTDEFDYSSSGTSPGTPIPFIGKVGSGRTCLSFPFCRRGSLPTDYFYLGDVSRVWSNQYS